MLSSMFKFRLPELQDSFILQDLVRLFELERPPGPPAWDLVKVLEFLRGPTFEPLHSCPIRVVTMKVLFLLSLTTAKRVGELQAIPCRVAFQGHNLSLACLPEFVTKTESKHNLIPHSFLVRSLAQFLDDLLEDLLLCPVRAVHIYLDLTSALSPRPHSSFESPRAPSRAPSLFLHQVIVETDALWEGSSPRAHSICGVVISAAFLRNWSVSKVFEAATWRSLPVFASFYFRDLTFTLDGCNSLSPFVAAGSFLT